MMKTMRFTLLMVVVFAMILLAACAVPAAEPTATSIPPTAVPPTDTPIPPTPLPPTPTPNPTPSETFRLPETVFSGDGVIEVGEFTSGALAGNLIGDPATRNYWVYLPPNYDQADKHYPVVYVLHYYTGVAGSWMKDMAARLDRLIARGEAPEMILVSPDAYNTFGGSWYMSSPTIGDYETYITKELVDIIDTNYRTISHRDSRGVTGCSMGGDGAMHLALTYPDVFGVVSGVSGTYEYERHPWWEEARIGFEEAPTELTEIRSLPMPVQWLMAGAAAVASSPDEPPLYLDMPFEIIDGEAQIVPDVAEKIIASDVLHDLDTYRQQSKNLNAIMIYHGSLDNGVPVDLARNFDRILTEQDVEHEYVEVGGGHCTLNHEPVIQFMADHLAVEMPEETTEAVTPIATSGHVENDGVRIYYEIVGEGPPLLLLHAVGSTSQNWYEMGYVNGLKDDYQLILVDWRGHGNSDKPTEPEAYTLELIASDVTAVLDELSIDQVHAFAEGSGEEGYALAKYTPERLSSLSVNDVLAKNVRSRNEELLNAASLNPDDLTEMLLNESHRGVSDEQWQEWVDNYVELLDREAIFAYASVEETGTADVLPEILAPLLILSGKHTDDHGTIRRQSEEMLNASFVALPQPSWWASRHADAVLPHLSHFLAGVREATEVPATKMEDIAGLWRGYFLDDARYVQYRLDGTYQYAHLIDNVLYPSLKFNYWFDNGVMHIQDHAGHSIIGKYEVTVRKDGDQPIFLSFAVIEDADAMRIRDMMKGRSWFELPAGGLEN